MPNTLIPKRSSVAGKVPLSTDLQVGEIAVNLADGLIYTKNAGGTVITLGGGGSGVASFNTRTGVVTLTSADVTTALGATPVYTTTNQTIAGDKTFSGLTNFTNGRAQVQSAGSAMWEMHIPGTHARGLYLSSDGVTRLATTNGAGVASTVQWSVDASSNFTSAGNVTAYSDERFKRDWTALPNNFVERLAAVKSGIYTRIDNELRQVGVGAQSLQQLMPEAVVGNDVLSVAYGNAALVSAVELAKRVVEQEDRIRKLEAALERLID